MAMLLITHDMGVVAEVADEVAVMRFGRIVEQGPVDEIFHAPEASLHPQLLASTLKLDARPSRQRRRAEAHAGAGALGPPPDQGLSARKSLAADRQVRADGGRRRQPRPLSRARTSASSARAARARPPSAG